MPEQVTITISKPVFDSLKRLAEPLVDTTDTVIKRLLDHWDTKLSENFIPPDSSSTVTPALWKSSRGDVLPVGTELRGLYMGNTYSAQVERGGILLHEKLYDNLSPAAMAAKNLAGTEGKAANTNGRDFWKFQDPTTGQWVPVSALRPSHRINSDELLAELEKME